MNVIDIVKEQIKASHKKVKTISKGVDFDDWYTIPEGINTNVAWQLGHLIISKPFQLVIAPISRTREIYTVLPFKEYLKQFGLGTKPMLRQEGSPTPEEMLQYFDAVQTFCLDKLSEFDTDALNDPTEVPHPIAKTKYESLMWSFQHEIWHCGQMAMISRELGKPLEYKPE